MERGRLEIVKISNGQDLGLERGIDGAEDIDIKMVDKNASILKSTKFTTPIVNP